MSKSDNGVTEDIDEILSSTRALEREVKELERKEAEKRGALKQILSELRQKFDVTSLDEAKKLLKTLEEKLRKDEDALRKGYATFVTKNGGCLVRGER